jgi:hypothetical protein
MGIWKYGDQIGWGPLVQGDQIFGDHLSMGTEFDGDRLSRGINFMGTVCPGGQKVGYRKSGDQIGSGPNVSQPLTSRGKNRKFHLIIGLTLENKFS